MILNLIRSFLLFINIAFVLAFLISCLAPFISPQLFWPVAFLGLGFLPLLGIQFFFIFFWLFFHKKYIFFSAITVLIGGWNISNHFAFSGCKKNVSESDFKVMSFNVNIFGLYDWNNNSESKNSMLKLIETVNPDVLCLQEFYTDNKKFNTLEILSKKYPYVHFHKTLTLEKNNHWGIVTFSKYPIVFRDQIIFDDVRHNVAISSDIKIENHTIRVFNTHLQSIYFSSDDFHGITQLRNGKAIEPTMKIIHKLWKAFTMRAAQVEMLTDLISISKHPVLLCGDFNDTPNSYTYHKLTKNKSDSFSEKGCGIGYTYSGPVPLMRIDYIIADRQIETVSHFIPGNGHSDHRAVVATFNFR